MATPEYTKGPADGNQLQQGQASTLNKASADAAAAMAANDQSGAGPSAEGQAAATPMAAQDEQLQAQMAAQGAGVQTGVPAPPPVHPTQMDDIQQFHGAPDARTAQFGSPSATRTPPPPQVAASMTFLQQAAQDPNASPALTTLLQNLQYHMGQ